MIRPLLVVSTLLANLNKGFFGDRGEASSPSGLLLVLLLLLREADDPPDEVWDEADDPPEEADELELRNWALLSEALVLPKELQLLLQLPTILGGRGGGGAFL